MAGSLNRATIIGHLGADPEIRRSRDGKAIANLRVATSETWRDKNSGEKRENTTWHTVVIFNEGLAGVAEKYLRKGSKVFIEGQLQTRMWEKDGHKNYTTEIVLQGFNSQLILLDGREGNGGGRNDRDDDRRGGDDYGSRSRGDDRRGNDRGGDRRDNRGGQQQQSRGGGGSFHDDMSDDIPFAPEWRV
jgi:single-strand DNA-binding protein